MSSVRRRIKSTVLLIVTSLYKHHTLQAYTDTLYVHTCSVFIIAQAFIRLLIRLHCLALFRVLMRLCVSERLWEEVNLS